MMYLAKLLSSHKNSVNYPQILPAPARVMVDLVKAGRIDQDTIAAFDTSRRELESFGFCSCNCVKSSSKLFMPLLSDMYRDLSSADRSKPIRLVSFGSGFLGNEIVALQLIYDMGFKDIVIDCIDKSFEADACQSFKDYSAKLSDAGSNVRFTYYSSSAQFIVAMKTNFEFLDPLQSRSLVWMIDTDIRECREDDEFMIDRAPLLQYGKIFFLDMLPTIDNQKTFYKVLYKPQVNSLATFIKLVRS